MQHIMGWSLTISCTWSSSILYTAMGLQNTLEHFIDDSNNISTRQAIQQENKETINAIEITKWMKHMLKDRHCTFRINLSINRGSSFKAQHINPARLKISKANSLLHCPNCEMQAHPTGLLTEMFSFNDPGEMILWCCQALLTTSCPKQLGRILAKTSIWIAGFKI